MSNIRISALALAGTLLLGGCATEKYVDQKVAALEAQVNAQDQARGQQISTLDVRVAAVEQAAREAMERANAAARGKFAYSVVATVDVGPFKVGGSTLTDDGKAKLSNLAGQLKSANRGVSIEVQGYTDESGSAAANYKLGWQRAETVRRFLGQQGVPLRHMASISYGEDAQTPGGRKENRRVVVVVLE
ncbi:OmpA family protein [Emcibacter sp. SYSU 3D8]|uniref:OmpA family protein n=1 Tax=Emcibacter sp. SYSU 3D8 TaxID=3133969 RepID=UPI0031FF39FF